MKKLLSITALFFPMLLFAQEKKRNFFKEHIYVKVSPTLLATAAVSENLPNEHSPAVSIFGAVGVKMRYAAVGFSSGYLNWGAGIAPLGIDLTITDYKQKVFPVLTAQWHQAHFTDKTSYGRRSTTVEGKNMYSIGAGGAFSVVKTMKMMVTAGVSKIDCNALQTSAAQPGSHYYFKGHYKLLFIAVSFAW